MDIDLDTLDLGTGQVATHNTASEKQLAFIERLKGEKDIPEGWEPLKVARDQWYAGEFTGGRGGAASALIDALLALPKRGQRPADAPEPEAGMYRGQDGTVYRVYLGQQSGRMLVKKVTLEWEGTKCYCSDLQGVLCGVCRGHVEARHVTGYGYEYLGAATRMLPADATAMPIEQAQQWGRMTGTCVMCGRRLDVPESVERGIGPICYDRMTGA